MSNYCELIIPAPAAIQELLIAELAENGYEGFEESAESLKAYINETDFEEIYINFLLSKYDLKYSKSIINKQNWNAIWESNFEPVQVDDFVGIRAGFHPPFTGLQHEIVITPKMSFGTGHHATTYMVMKLMQEIDFTGTSVYDFGTGTGILAILAEKLGAVSLLATDNDDWCIENASENILINNCNHIDIQKIESLFFDRGYDVILANINKHILLASMTELGKGLTVKGVLILSGLLKEDEADILAEAGKCGLVHQLTVERLGWIACRFVRKK